MGRLELSWVAVVLTGAALISIIDKTVIHRYARTPDLQPMAIGITMMAVGLPLLVTGIPPSATRHPLGAHLRPVLRPRHPHPRLRTLRSRGLASHPRLPDVSCLHRTHSIPVPRRTTRYRPVARSARGCSRRDAAVFRPAPAWSRLAVQQGIPTACARQRHRGQLLRIRQVGG